MLNWVKEFRATETGAVTVDWVVLTAGILVFGILVVSAISEGATQSSTAVGNQLGTAAVPEIAF